MGGHALLSASSSHRWINCPPSARLCENCEDQGSEYAQQGTDAHSLCQYKVESALGMDTAHPAETLASMTKKWKTVQTAMPSMCWNRERKHWKAVLTL